ncbi:iron-sulfur cluster assembly protein, partial [Jatrophihabitans endophyticus]|uniref:iron-sulfur cluster assembly protein n=1 Tax=Jatrophihabitans endophyticus TaxID=1206085 RepID=UPI0019F1BB00
MSRSAMTEELRRAVGRVIDPELRRSVADLGSLRDLQVGRRGDVTVRLAVATADGEQADALVAAVRSAAQGVEGTRRVEVVLDSMNDAERAAAR